MWIRTLCIIELGLHRVDKEQTLDGRRRRAALQLDRAFTLPGNGRE